MKQTGRLRKFECTFVHRAGLTRRISVYAIDDATAERMAWPGRNQRLASDVGRPVGGLGGAVMASDVRATWHGSKVVLVPASMLGSIFLESDRLVVSRGDFTFLRVRARNSA